jgi:oxygen-independent coproporphyrinogen-3 oxidase
MQASLYIHIPFCSSLCDYCDFYSVSIKNFNHDYIDTFILALITGIKNQIDFFGVKEIPTVYIGGGTPSVLGEKLRYLFKVLKTIPGFSPVEFTVEANPESINENFLDACIEGGVNRLSIGVQTFHEPSRVAVNRKCISLVSRFFDSVQTQMSLSFDLITGLPQSCKKTVLYDIEKILDFNPAHISLYAVSVEDNTPLKEKLKKGTVLLPDNDKQDYLYLIGCDALKNAGFQHYEVSNFARFNSYCQHNIRYWQMNGWLGVGPSASGTIIDENSGTAIRYTYPPDVDAYIKLIDTSQTVKKNCLLDKTYFEELKSEVFLKECIFMGFRYINGPDPVLFKKRFGCTVEECIPKTLKRWEGKDKMLFLNSFLTDAFTEIDNGVLILK